MKELYINQNELFQLSLLNQCPGCTCCEKGGTPIVGQKEQKIISQESGKDYFKKIIVENGEEYFIIGYNKDGSERNLSKDPCPYFTNERLCSIHKIKPLDCFLYPLKPFFQSADDKEPIWALDHQCPAAANLSDAFHQTALKVGRQFLKQFLPTQLAHYVKNYNTWIPKGGNIKKGQ